MICLQILSTNDFHMIVSCDTNFHCILLHENYVYLNHSWYFLIINTTASKKEYTIHISFPLMGFQFPSAIRLLLYSWWHLAFFTYLSQISWTTQYNIWEIDSYDHQFRIAFRLVFLKLRLLPRNEHRPKPCLFSFFQNSKMSFKNQ